MHCFFFFVKQLALLYLQNDHIESIKRATDSFVMVFEFLTSEMTTRLLTASIVPKLLWYTGLIVRRAFHFACGTVHVHANSAGINGNCLTV